MTVTGSLHPSNREAAAACILEFCILCCPAFFSLDFSIHMTVTGARGIENQTENQVHTVIFYRYK